MTFNALSDTMVSIMMRTPQELMQDIAARAKARRLALDLTQMGLEQRSGVSLGTIKLFERTGKISLESLLKLAVAFGCARDFESLFTLVASSADPVSLDDLLKAPKQRKRGRLA